MSPDITKILDEIRGGDERASEELLVLLYDELRTLARKKMAHERPGQTLQATALVHEAYLRLVGSAETPGASWANRAHFFKAAAETMRRILIDRAREKGALKRGGDLRRFSLDGASLTLDEVPAELLDLDAALTRLAAEHPTKAELVKLRFFGGLTLPEAAEAIGISPSTADRHWAFAKVWLYRQMEDSRDSVG